MDNYKQPVRADMIREISKRGIRVQRKDKNGTINKKTNDIGPSSWFGWGCVDDTIPGLKKDLDFIKKNFESILDQVVAGGRDEIDSLFDDVELEVEEVRVPEPPKKKQTIEPPPVPPPALAPGVGQSLLDQWYHQWSRAFDIGDLGLVPDCYSKKKPTLEEIMESNVGCVMKHFHKFMRNKFTC